jgi:hypothetical protein
MLEGGVPLTMRMIMGKFLTKRAELCTKVFND